MQSSVASEASSGPAPDQPQSPTQHAFAYRGEALSLFVLMLKNMALTLLTLGIYLPWAKTERRKYLWQNLEIAGHRLRYHGTGKELLVGYAKVVVGYLVFIGLPMAVSRLIGAGVGVAVQVALALALIPLIPYAIWGSQRYLLSRTSWRGIRFRLEGSAGPYARTFLLGYLFTILSLGIYAPIWFNRIHALIVNATALGTQNFSYRGEDEQAFRIGIKGFVLTILTLGLYSFWYQAELIRFQLNHTSFDGAQGQSELSGADLFKLTMIQILALTFSLGLAFPWVATYSLQFTLSRLRFVGPVEFARVYQVHSSGDPSADGLADALDVGLAL